MNATSDTTKTFIAAISGGKQKEIYGSAYQTRLSTKHEGYAANSMMNDAEV